MIKNGAGEQDDDGSVALSFSHSPLLLLFERGGRVGGPSHEKGDHETKKEPPPLTCLVSTRRKNHVTYPHTI